MSGNAGNILPLGDYRARQRTLYFTRAELNQLLSLYSRHVARGIWRDYAIDNRDGIAQFSVFRHTHESPAYRIVKSLPSPTQGAEFAVISGRQRLRVARNLGEALELFRSKVTLVG
jgi:hypothetical protein